LTAEIGTWAIAAVKRDTSYNGMNCLVSPCRRVAREPPFWAGAY
jgi:hypothetical protein